jgi:hypothetical protein
VIVEAELVSMAPHPGDDEAEAGPVVEPSMQQPQLRGARGKLQETEGGAQGGEATVGGRGHRVEGSRRDRRRARWRVGCVVRRG